MISYNTYHHAKYINNTNYIDLQNMLNIILLSFFIKYALKKKITASSNETKRKDWLEYADYKYNTHKISELRSALDVMYLLIPIPLFYTLFDQQVSYFIKYVN